MNRLTKEGTEMKSMDKILLSMDKILKSESMDKILLKQSAAGKICLIYFCKTYQRKCAAGNFF